MDKTEIIMSFPHYSYPTYLLIDLFIDVLLGGRRSFRSDAVACIARLTPPLRVLGNQNIPSVGACLLTFNHYSRPGFNAWWTTLAIASQLPLEAHFIMTNELTFPGKWFAPVGRPLSHWALKRGAKVYDFTSMPPMPPREKDVAARAQSVREVLSFVVHMKNPVVCLAPEGGDMPGGRLAMPPMGLGRFVAHLVNKGLRLIPVGIWEQENLLCIRFGPAYDLAVQRGAPSDQLDRRVAKQVMEHIALLLPSHLRGDFQ
jgi:Acyltransferase